jgi:hypothetical protein
MDTLWQHFSNTHRGATGGKRAGRTEQLNMLCCSTSCPQHNIMSGHAYAALAFLEIDMFDDGDFQRMVQVRNPWGHGQEWNGRWSDKDPRWASVDDAVKARMQYEDDEDGTWWMDFNDFVHCFDMVNMCRLLWPPTWTFHHATGEWFGETAGGQFSSDNPQYQLYVHTTCRVIVNVGTTSARLYGGKYDFGIGPLVEIPDEEQTGDTRGKRRLEINSRRLQKAIKLERDRECAVELTLEASEEPYYIIPITTRPNQEGMYFLSVFTSAASTFLHVPDGSMGYNQELQCQGGIRGVSAAGCYPNNPGWHKNPQFLLTVEGEEGDPIDLKIQLRQHAGDNNTETTAIGFIVTRADAGCTLFSLSDDDLLASTTITNSDSVSLDVSLSSPGTYAVVPFAFEPGVPFQFTLAAMADAGLSAFEPMPRWNTQLCAGGAWSLSTDMAGGCCNHPASWLQNPTAMLLLENEAEITISISPSLENAISFPTGVAVFEGAPSRSKTPLGGAPWHQNGWTGTLEPGSYSVVAQTFNVGDEGGFDLQVVSRDEGLSWGDLEGVEVNEGEDELDSGCSDSTWSDCS